MCLVEVPAKYRTVYKLMLVKPAATREITIPAQYQTIKKQVMTNPPTTRKIEIPAEYKTVKVKKLATPAEVKRIPIPAEYQTVASRVKVTEGKMEWRRILCETNLDRTTVANIQRALLKAGFNPGPIDGVIGRDTLSALRAYQQDKGLAVGNLTYETLQSLGIKTASAS
jgi:peptidoglycan hydrolase-like protein with peptidoglycan-binding domain